jgi:hypothetical protein
MPTATLTAAMIRDCPIVSDTPDNNRGTLGTMSVGYGVGARRRTLIKIVSPATNIPAGLLTAARLCLWRYPRASGSPNSGYLTAYRITDANTWVEGDEINSIGVGAACWNYAKYDTQAWAGSVGCGTEDVDYIADASPITVAFDAYTAGPDVLVTLPIPAAWFTAWRDGAVNNGLLLRTLDEGNNCILDVRSADAASNTPYIEVDYVLPASMPWLASRRL